MLDGTPDGSSEARLPWTGDDVGSSGPTACDGVLDGPSDIVPCPTVGLVVSTEEGVMEGGSESIKDGVPVDGLAVSNETIDGADEPETLGFAEGASDGKNVAATGTGSWVGILVGLGVCGTALGSEEDPVLVPANVLGEADGLSEGAALSSIGKPGPDPPVLSPSLGAELGNPVG